MIIAVASGKGGTGKTTVATSMALALAETGRPVSFLDCDVEAPNAHLFLHPVFEAEKNVDLLIPQVDEALCSGCGQCAEVCQFHAIVVLGGKTLVFPEMCHGCGSCTLVCPEGAITEVPETLGILQAGSVPGGIHFARGLLNMAVPVIHQLKKWQLRGTAEVVIVDSSPGASCPVVESLRGADFILLVTEPTPFGLHDLQLAVELTQEIGVPTGVIINREGIGDARVMEYCQEVGLPVLMRIPYSREIGEGIARGKTLVAIHPEYREMFREMVARIEALAVREEART